MTSAPYTVLLVTFSECAAKLGWSRATLRRELRAGAPQARPGRRGNGGEAMLDPHAIAAWRAGRSGLRTVDAAIRMLAAEIPAVIAVELETQFRYIAGPHKRATGKEFQQAWGRISSAITQLLREQVTDLPDVTPVPAAVSRMFVE